MKYLPLWIVRLAASAALLLPAAGIGVHPNFVSAANIYAWFICVIAAISIPSLIFSRAASEYIRQSWADLSAFAKVISLATYAAFAVALAYAGWIAMFGTYLIFILVFLASVIKDTSHK